MSYKYFFSHGNMKLDKIVECYQKKIGTYDKQEWEKTIEQKILNSFNSITLKNAKLKTEFIDVDLVRGSSFPKAKPKQTLLTVIRLAILRYLFLPTYAKWWVSHTSLELFFVFLILYIVQMLNWAIYINNIHKISRNTEQNIEHIVPLCELIIPMILSFILSLIHSLIVATNSTNNTRLNSKCKHLFNKNGKPSREKVRRRKKFVRNPLHFETSDSSEIKSKTSNNDSTIGNLDSINSSKLIKTENIIRTQAIIENERKFDYQTSDNDDAITKNIIKDIEINENLEKLNTVNNKYSGINLLDISKKISDRVTTEVQISTDITNSTTKCCNDNNSNKNTNDYDSINDSNSLINRNVYLNSKIHENIFDKSDNINEKHYDDNICYLQNIVEDNSNENIENQISITQTISFTNNSKINQQQKPEEDNKSRNQKEDNNAGNNSFELHVEDDGFESLNGKSSSGEENRNSNIMNKSNINCHEVVHPKNQIRQRTTAFNRNSNKINHMSRNVLNQNIPSVIDDDHNDDDDDNDETNFRKGFDKLNKRYSIPIAWNSRRKDLQMNSSNSITNISKYCKNLPSKSDNVNMVKINNPQFSVTNPSNESSDIDEEEIKVNLHKPITPILSEGLENGITTVPIISTTKTTTGPYAECSVSATEWLGITTNSEECSYSSEPNSDLKEDSDEISEHEFAPTVLLNSHGSNDIINCTIWDRNDPKKAEMSVLDISSYIIEQVEAMPDSSDYIYIGVVFSIVLSLIPPLCRLCEGTVNWESSTEISYLDVPILLWEKTAFSLTSIIELAFGKSDWERTVLFLGFFQRFILTFLLFFLFAVAERTFKQRFLYAKLFSHLTSSRRARKSNLPHFRLNKVRNIKTWLSVRSYLKRRGPQRSVDVIVSTAFSITLLLLGFLSVECLKDSVHIHSQLNLEALFWSGGIGIYLLRFMTLGNKINRKYRSISVLITEQINLYLQIEQKPKKKEELMVANSVLKLAADLLKELESPFKISGLSANPYLFTLVKVVILSAFSGVLSELLGFKLKLHKIKIK